jgi:hypothetical protein
MKVSKVIEILNTMKPDDEVVCVMWDKETMAGYIDNEEHLLTDSTWKLVASEFEVGALDLPIGNALRKALDESMQADKEDLLAYTTAIIEEQQLWDRPATKITGEQNDNAQSNRR